MNKSLRFLSLLLLPALLILGACQREQTLELRIIHTTDVHANLFPYDHIQQTPGTGSLARLSSMMRQVRQETPEALLLDGGDLLQGEPVAYYYNYIDSTSPHIVASAMNFLDYDAATIGNHDIEPGHAVYDRWVEQCKFPILGANAVSEDTGAPYFVPYKVFERGGARIAVLGLTTPAIPQWLPKHLWRGMRFEDIIASAQQWVPRILKEEQPDMLVALIHSGYENTNDDYLENAGSALAQTVEGIDLILMGHDHRRSLEWIPSPSGDSVLLINPANHLDYASDVRITLRKRAGKVIEKKIDASFADVNAFEPDPEYVKEFAAAEERTRDFLGKRIGLLEQAVRADEAIFGPSSYMSVVHEMQLHTVEAEISFAAPLSLGAKLSAGEVFVRDLFKFCPYSNHLYAMELTGAEIKGYLEHSYGLWVSQMKGAEDHLILMRPDAKPGDRYKTLHPTYNFSAAHGIDYRVDVSKPKGSRITILQLSNGEPFDLNRRYRVAINSYRAGGAGGMLTTGAGIAKEDLPARILSSSDHDQFFSLMRFFEIKSRVNPERPKNWSFLPAAWVHEAIKRDKAFLFP